MRARRDQRARSKPATSRTKPVPRIRGTAMTRSGWAYLQAERRWQAFLRSRASTDTHRSGRDVLDLAKARRARLGPSPGGSATKTVRCASCRGTGKLLSGTVCPLCAGRGRVPATAAAAMAAPGRVNQEAPGSGGAGPSQGGQPGGEAPRSARADLNRAKVMRARRAGPAGYTEPELARLGQEGKALAKKGGGWWLPITSLAELQDALAIYKNMDGDKTGIRAHIVKRAILLRLVDHLPVGWAEPKVKLHPNEISAGNTP